MKSSTCEPPIHRGTCSLCMIRNQLLIHILSLCVYVSVCLCVSPSAVSPFFNYTVYTVYFSPSFYFYPLVLFPFLFLSIFIPPSFLLHLALPRFFLLSVGFCISKKSSPLKRKTQKEYMPKKEKEKKKNDCK